MRRGIPTRAGVKGRGIERPNLDLAKSDRAPRLNQSKSPLSDYLILQQKFSQSLVANIGREAGKKLWTRCLHEGSTHRLRYLGHRLVMYGFVGVSLASSQDININPLPICKHLADLFSTQEEPDSKPIGQKVEDYQFGRLIATGCDAAVYEVQETKSSGQQYSGPLFRSNSLESVTEEESLSEESIVSEEEYEIVHEESFELISPESSDVEMESVTSDVPSDGMLNQPESLPAESVCIKVMFNYGISSNSASIKRAMRRELVPALMTDDCDSYLRGAHVKKKPTRQLPPHPNIIPIYGWFVDTTPLLEDALDVYPIALPLRLCEDGCGRNSTMFIVMKQYESTLAEHIQACGPPDTRDGVLLLLQLLHGIQHLQQNNIAHRDLKSDNLLMEWSEGHPHLVLSDFGHCLTSPLLMPYPNDCMDKGGNGKLMAPEIATAKPGPGSYLDFRASDSWAAGTIAYEIFGGANPFYTSAFDGRFYKEDELPALPPSVPACVQKVVRGLLRRDPNKRLPSSVAASVLALWLWAPEEWHSQAPSQLDVLRWLVNYMSAAALLGVPERQQMALFLSQLEWRTLWQAIELISAADEN